MFSMTSSSRLAKAATLALLATAAVLLSDHCQAGVRYESEYQAFGRRYKASIDIDGESGFFETFDSFGRPTGSGQLSNLQINALGTRLVLTGAWNWESANGEKRQEGQLRWVFDEAASRFNGHYTVGSASGTWKGRYSTGGGQLGANGPFIGNLP